MINILTTRNKTALGIQEADVFLVILPYYDV